MSIISEIKDTGKKLGLTKDRGSITILGGIDSSIIETEFDVLSRDPDLVFEVVSRHNISNSKKLTSKKSEAGFVISDNVTINPTKIALQIISNEWDWRVKKSLLEQIYADRTTKIAFYSHVDKKVYTPYVIESLDIAASVGQANGYTANLTLKEVIITQALTAETSLDTVADSKGTQTQENAFTSTEETSLAQDGSTGKVFGPDGVEKQFDVKGNIIKGREAGLTIGQ